MLEHWIEPAHRDIAITKSLRTAFEADPARLLVLDGFLRRERYECISHALRSDCEWTTHYGIDGGGQVIGRDLYESTPAERHLYRNGNFLSPKKGREFSPGILDMVRFRVLAQDPEFVGWLEALTGIATSRVDELLIRRMDRDDFSKRHNDRLPGRALCLLLYFNDDWQRDMGGTFRVFAPEGPRVIEPLPNRAIIFDVNTGQSHCVDPLLGVPADWYRYNFTLWLG